MALKDVSYYNGNTVVVASIEETDHDIVVGRVDFLKHKYVTDSVTPGLTSSELAELQELTAGL